MDQDKEKEKRVKKEVERQSKKIKKNFSVIKCLVSAIILLPTFLFLLNFYLALELDHGQWFSRSGSIIIMLCIIADFLILSNYRFMKPTGPDKAIRWETLDIWRKLEEKYDDRNRSWTIVVFIPTLIGTIIWGYGDLIWNLSADAL